MALNEKPGMTIRVYLFGAPLRGLIERWVDFVRLLVMVLGSIVGMYAVSLVLIFLSERLTTSDLARMVLSGLGVLGAVVTTALRFLRTDRGNSDLRSSERTLSLLYAGGLLALAIYFATTTEAGRNLLGVTTAAPATRARIDGAAAVAWIAILVISLIPLFFGELALAPMRRAPQPEVRRVRAAIAAGLSISFAAVYCTLFTYAAGELDYKADFSFFRTGRPSESTKNIAATASEPIKVMAFFPEINEVGTEVKGYLKELGQASPNIKVESHDRLMVPGIAKDAKVSQDGVVVLARGASRETVVIGAEMLSAKAKLKTLDGDFQKALIKVLREAHIAYLTVGHGELNETTTGASAEDLRTAKGLRKLLESQNFQVKDLGLAQGLGTEIPADATLVAVIGPSQPFLPEEVSALDKYAERGGHLLLALDPEAKVDWNPLANVAGLAWHKTLLANDKVFLRRRSNPSDRTLLVTNRFSSHASVSTLSRNSARAAVFFLGASSLDKMDGADHKVDFAVKSFAETFNDENGDFEFSPGGDEKRNAWNLGAAVSKSVPPPEGYKGKDPPEMRAFVIADADALSDVAFLNSELNQLFAVDVVRWLGGEESFSGSITTTEDVRIAHTTTKDKVWFWATIGGAPGLVLGLGLFATWPRRKKEKIKAPPPAKPAKKPARTAAKEKKA